MSFHLTRLDDPALLDAVAAKTEQARELLRQIAYERVAVKTVMQGTRLVEYAGMLPEEVREARRARFMEVAEEVSTARLQRRVGQVMKVIVDKAVSLGKKGGIGRTYADAPEIDGVVHIQPPEKASKTYKVGDFVKARVVEAQGHDLVAQIL